MSDRHEDELQSTIKRLEDQLAAMRLAEAALRMSEEEYRKIFDYAPVSIREEDVSELEAAFEDLRGQGVSDFRRYFDEHPSFLEKAQQLIKIGRLNDATLSLYGAKTREELIGSLKKPWFPNPWRFFVRNWPSSRKGKRLLRERISIRLSMAAGSMFS